MKYFSFKILLLCVILPPLLHIVTVVSIEKYLQSKYKVEVQNIYTGDTKPLFDGSIKLKEAINNNIEKYLQKKALIKWGVKTDIMVATRQDIILYPSSYDDEGGLTIPTKHEIAADNYRLMDQGLIVKVDVSLVKTSPLVILIFCFFSFISLLILYRYYRAGSKKAKMEYLIKNEEIDRLRDLEKRHSSRLEALREDKHYIVTEFRKVKKNFEIENIKAARNEDSLIDEIVSLENKVKKTIELFNQQQLENDSLQEIIKEYEKKKEKIEKHDKKSSATANKRFNAIYKNCSFHIKASQGYCELDDEMKIKAEEIIYQLNSDPESVNVKRKLKLKKNKVFEINFSYNGRLYFMKDKNNKINILSIGTKNSQQRDLNFLETFKAA